MKYDRADLLPQYENLDPEWNNRKEGRFEDDMKEERFRDFTARLAHRNESRIVVVSHGNVLEEILGEYAPEENAEVKVYTLCGGKWIYMGPEAKVADPDDLGDRDDSDDRATTSTTIINVPDDPEDLADAEDPDDPADPATTTTPTNTTDDADDSGDNQYLVSGANRLGRACLAFVMAFLGARAFRTHA